VTLEKLQRLARAQGILTSYVNASGKQVKASRATLLALVEILKTDEPRLQPVFVQWDGKPKRIKLPTGRPAQLRLGSGKTLTITGSVLPHSPFGYHKLEVAGRESLVISAPTKSYSDRALERAWGIFAPTYAWRSGSIGFSNWKRVIDWLHPMAGTVIATLPLLASFMQWPVCEPSPYSPASRLFWNEFYVDVDLPPGKSELVDYTNIARAKRAALEAEAVRFFSSGGSAQFERYQASNMHLDDYAAFRAACDKQRRSWQSWPQRMCNGDLRRGDYDERVKNYYAYVQWRAQEEMGELLRDCRRKQITFYLDLPLGVHPAGYDVWRERESFAPDVNAGAPPDPFFTKGQDWGFAPLHPQRIRQTHYRHVIEYLRFQMRHTGMLRIDHVMGLHRLYWIPKGWPASEGAYVQYRVEEFYAILSLESHRHKTMLVGENLGTVPPEVDAAMVRHGLRETYVLQYELGHKVRRPPQRSVASLNTHDMSTFEAFLRGLDIDDRFDLGLIKNLAREHRERKRLIAALEKLLGTKSGLLEAALRWLGRSEAEVVLVNLEDLWRETLPQNIPGTSSERPNWRRKLRYSLDEIKTDPEIHRLLKLLADARGQRRTTGSRGRARGKRASVLAPR
jgi:4-alpha-glucanotransferase